MEEVKFGFTLSDINNLLIEMCDFMDSILIYLPPTSQQKAKFLIDKTSKITGTEFNPYLNMDRKVSQGSVGEEYVQPIIPQKICPIDEDVENYEIPKISTQSTKVIKEEPKQESVAEQTQSKETILSTDSQSDECPYRQVSASQISLSAIKYGPLLRPGSFWYLKRFRKLRKCYAAIRENWLIIYLTDHDTKPQHYVNLIHCTAIAQTDDNKKDFTFEIKSKTDMRKLYQFNAYTAEDMEQWIYLINDIGKDSYGKIGLNKTNRQLPSVPHVENGEDYEIVNTMNFDVQSPRLDDEMYAVVGQTSPEQHISASMNSSTSSDIYSSVDNYYSNVQESRIIQNGGDNEDKYETVGTCASNEKRKIPLISQHSFLHRHAKMIK